MRNKRCHLILLVLACTQVCNVQKIIKFEYDPLYSTCSESKAVHEKKNTLLFETILEYNKSIDLNMWFSFDILYVNRNHKSPPVMLKDMPIRDCESKLMALHELFGRCFVAEDYVYMTIPVVASLKFSNMDILARWTSLKHGHVLYETPLHGPVIVEQEYDYLKVNGKVQESDIIKYKSYDSTPMHIQYCAEKISGHTLIIEYRELRDISEQTCMAVYIRPRQGSILSVGFDETEGPCKQIKRNFYGFLQDKMRQVGSTNKCSGTHFVNKELVVLLLLFIAGV